MQSTTLEISIAVTRSCRPRRQSREYLGPHRCALLTACLLIGSYRTALAAGTMSEQQSSDIRRMVQAAPLGQPIELDFSDPAAYRFYVNQLKDAGIQADKYPEQYRVLTKTRQAHSKLGASRPAEQPKAQAPAADPSPIKPIQIFTALGRSDQRTYTASVLSSVPNQPYCSQVTLRLFDVHMNPIGDPAAAQQYHAGEDLSVKATGTAAPGTVVVALATYFWQGQNGTPHHGYMKATTGADPIEIKNFAPTPKPGQNVIKLCLGRSGDDCTYKPEGGSGSNVLMPVKGNATFSSDIDQGPSADRQAIIVMARPDAGDGGGCVVVSTSDFFDPKYTQINGRTISWDLKPAQFQPVDGCLKPNSQAIFTLDLFLTLKSGVPAYASITNAPGVPSEMPFLTIPPLWVYYSCLAEGTLVEAADGTTKRIEAIESGESVLTTAAGASMKVDSKLKGTEQVPMVRLVTRNGYNLLLTDGHPVVTPNGVLLAGALKTGDQVMTRKGVSHLASATREIFAGSVWNLNLGPTSEAHSRATDDTTFFGNGILVGDNQMQFFYNRKYKHQPELLRRVLPSRWHRDHQSYVSTSSNRSRESEKTDAK